MTQGAEAFKPDPESEEKRATVLPIREVNPMWSKHARFMAETAGITLSPETVMMYGLLRDEKPNPSKENHSGMSDHEILAEALRMSGDKDSLATFEESLPHIFKKKP